jgi:hypothetical protein
MNVHSPELLDRNRRVRARLLMLIASTEGLRTEPILDHVKVLAGDKKVGWYMLSHHGDGRLDLNLRVPKGDAEILIGSNPEVYHVPAYVARFGWVGVYLDGDNVPWAELADLLQRVAEFGAARSRRGQKWG